jgi:hypothetical protein
MHLGFSIEESWRAYEVSKLPDVDRCAEVNEVVNRRLADALDADRVERIPRLHQPILKIDLHDLRRDPSTVRPRRSAEQR